MIDHQDIENSIAEKAKDDAGFAHTYAILRLARQIAEHNKIMASSNRPYPFSRGFGSIFSEHIPGYSSRPQDYVNINRPEKPSDAK